MANSNIEIPFYAASGGAGLTGAAAEMNFEFLKTLSGVDESASAPSISEIGGGWYKFPVAYGTAPFDAGDLVGVIDADKDAANGLGDAERFIPVEIRLDFYALSRMVGPMAQNKVSGDMTIKNNDGDAILELAITDNEQTIGRDPKAVS
jgi:hypothetical protein